LNILQSRAGLLGALGELKDDLFGGAVRHSSQFSVPSSQFSVPSSQHRDCNRSMVAVPGV
jgi:hypothetical protein